MQLMFMKDDDMKKASDCFNKAANAAQDMLEMKKKFLDKDETVHKKWSEELEDVAAAGVIIRNILKIPPGLTDPMMERLKNFENKVEQLGKSVESHFEEMKLLVKDVTIFNTAMCPTAVLTSFLKDCLKYPGLDTLKNFREAYHINPPLKLAYNLIHFLEDTSNNSFKIALGAEISSSIEKWHIVICRIFGHFVLIEAFARGLLGTISKYNQEKLMKRAIQACDAIGEYKKENVEHHWDEIKKYLNEYKPKNDMTNAQRADEIMKKLDSYSTSDAFYLCVFKEGTKNIDYSYHCANESTQLIPVWNNDKCYALVYRSRTAKTLQPDDYKKTKTDVKNCRSGKLNSSGNLENMIQQQLLDKQLIRSDGFSCLIENKSDVQVRFTNISGNDKGPGWWERVAIGSTNQKDASQKVLIYSFP